MDRKIRFQIFQQIDDILIDECKNCSMRNQSQFCRVACDFGLKLQELGNLLDPQESEKFMTNTIVEKEEFLKCLKDGLTPKQTCERLGLKRNSYNYYKKKFTEDNPLEVNSLQPSASAIENNVSTPPPISDLKSTTIVQPPVALEELTKELESERMKNQYAAERVNDLELQLGYYEDLQLSWQKAQKEIERLNSLLIITEREIEQSEQQVQAFKNLVKTLI